jgi:hypothetical protein
MGGVHAFSDSDVYIMGQMSEGRAPWKTFSGKHWDGAVWGTDIHASDIEIGHTPNDVTGDSYFMVSVGHWGLDNVTLAALAEYDNKTKKWKAFHFQTQGELRSIWTDRKGFYIAVGDNGMVYTKEGYSSDWIYQKAPSNFHLTNITGISRNEVYINGVLNLTSGEHFTQGWKFESGIWKKLYDTQDSTGTILGLTSTDSPNEIGVWRCNVTDSLKLYIIGDQSYLFESKNQEMVFRKTNLSDFGLPLKNKGRTGLHINIFTDKDIWIIGTRYNFYHWDGNNFVRMYVATLPTDDAQFGWQLKLIKTTSGKIFFTSEISSRIYVVIQLTFI